MLTPTSTTLRKYLDSGKIVVLPGVYEYGFGISARIALSEGFDGLYMTGAGTSASVLGQPDLGLVTLNDMVQNASMITSLNPKVPVVADADTGFGGAPQCYRLCSMYIRAGIAGFHIEDQVQQKRCGHLASKQLVPVEEYLVRIKAAANARKALESDIVIIARSDAAAVLGVDEAIKRVKLAAEAGADVLFVEGLKTKEEAEKTVRELAPYPVLLNLATGGVTPDWTADEAQGMGFKIAIYPCASMIPAALAIQRSLRALKATGTDKPAIEDSGPRQFFQMVGLAEVTAIDAAAGSVMYQSEV